MKILKYICLLSINLSISLYCYSSCSDGKIFAGSTENGLLEITDGEYEICLGEMVVLKVEDKIKCDTINLNQKKIQWFANGIKINGATNDIYMTTELDSTTSYEVRISKGNNCSCSFEISISIRTQIEVGITDNIPNGQTPCEDEVIKLTANVDGGTEPYTYNWGHISGDNSDEGKTVDSKVLKNGNRNHSVTVTDDNGCKNNITTTISFNPKPSIDLNNTERFCPGDTITLVASTEAGATCKWIFPNNAELNNCAFTVDENDVGSYTVEVSKDGCTNQKEVDIKTFNPDIPNLIEDKTECAGSSEFNLQIAPFRTDGTYSINGNPVSDNIIQDDKFYPQRTAGAGTYEVEYLYTYGNGCSSTTTTTITLIKPPTVSFSELPTLCKNSDPVNLMDFVSPKGGVFKRGNNVIDATLNPINSGSGTITYIYPNESSACKVSMDKSITINNSITFTDLTDKQICEGKDKIELKVESLSGGGNGSYTFNWNLEGADNDLLNPRNGMQTTLTSSDLAASSNSITASVTVGNNFAACKTTKSLDIEVFKQASLSIDQTPDNVCSGQNITLCANVTGGTGNINYRWNNSNNRKSIDVSNVRESITNSVMISFSNSQETGCMERNADKTTIPFETPAPKIMMLPNGDNEICGNQQSIFVSTNQRPGSTFSWGYPSGKTEEGKVTGDGTAVLSINWNDFVSGTGVITIIERLPGCIGTDALTVNFSSKKAEDPAEIFRSSINNILIYNDDTVCDNEYQWGYIETTENGFSQDVVAEITREGNPPDDVPGGTYQSYVASSLYNPNRFYWVSVKDENCDCSQTVLFDPRSSENVLPTTPKFVLYPNPTPDRFRLEVTHLLPDAAYDIQIYNSLGQLVKTQTARTQNDVLNEEVDMSIYPSGVYHTALVYKGAVLKVQSFILQP